jgi:hypothetical protein
MGEFRGMTGTPKPRAGVSTWSMLQGPGFELKVNATLTEKDKQSVLLQGK